MGQNPTRLLLLERIKKKQKLEVEMKASVFLQRKNLFDLNEQLAFVADDLVDLVGKHVELQLVSVDIDGDTGVGKRSNIAKLEKWASTHDSFEADVGETYTVNFKVDADFGTPGAILVENHHPNWFYLKHIILHTPYSVLYFPCYSWVYNHRHYDAPRIFFSNQVYLPNQTPAGLVDLRYLELEQLRGDGKGERLRPHRIYDYDVYNDLGDPDKDKELYGRTILGGSKEFPYPRRCRTGRARTNTDPASERPVLLPELVYVPMDERFKHIKKSDFLGSSIKSFTHGAVPVIERLIEDRKDFLRMEDVQDLYSKGLDLSSNDILPLTEQEKLAGIVHPLEIVKEIVDPETGDPHIIKFPKPQVIQDSDTAWSEDDEFARQMLAGLNPIVISRITEFPIVSKLDPDVYGDRTSSIMQAHLQRSLENLTVTEVVPSIIYFLKVIWEKLKGRKYVPI